MPEEDDENERWTTSTNLFATARVGRYKYEFRKNGVGNAYWVKVISLDGEILNKHSDGHRMIDFSYIETSQSSSLRIFDQKLSSLLKKYN